MINEQIKAGYKLLSVLKGNPEILEESKALSIENPFFNEETNTFFRVWKEEMKVKKGALSLISASKKFKEIYPQATTIQEIRACGGEFHNWKTYDHLIFEGWAKGKLSRLGAHLIQGQTTAEDTENLLLTANETITAIDAFSNTDEEQTKDEALNEVVKDWVDRCNGEQGAFIPTGIDGLDKLIKGFKKGTMVVLGARPRVGKTALGLSIMNNMVNDGVFCGFVSVEMTKKECFERLAYIEGEINPDFAETNCAQGLQEATKAIGELRSNPRYEIMDTTRRQVSNVRRMIREIMRRQPKTEVVFVDYLQKIMSDDGSKDPRNRVMEISGVLTDIAKELDICIVPMAQLNRGADENNFPNLSNLQESSAIEQDAHLVIAIHRSMVAQMEASTYGKTNTGTWKESGKVSCEEQELNALQSYLIVLKNRSGRDGFAKCIYNAPSTKFKSDESWKDEGSYM
jgi:replicative DNA helicase